eukprot:TRINITY_DN8388_c0_g1_i1.p1 TRINITY_DN8388_c0_g1~~TRINITY_DN8388_c0_g1_i1.p1  ORF type:complete len:236 (-),score=62.04 TRINITY_DN8388_c0_g1_i1:52-759(-)
MVMRFFGASKPKVPGPTLDEVTENVDKRVTVLDEKIRKLETELVKYREQMKRIRPGPAQNGIKKRAMQILQQKKMYEQQRDQLMGQQFNMEQTLMTTQSMKDTVVTVQAMKEAQATMKQTYKSINIDSIENLKDEMEDMFEVSNEIQDVLARSYFVPDDVNEDDLESELAALGDDFLEEEVPSYLQAPTSVPVSDQGSYMNTTSPSYAVQNNTRPSEVQVDFGMPSVPTQLERGW